MENTIQITHFVSPYQFWYKRSQLHVIRRMEIVFQEEVHKFCIEQYDAEETGPDGYYEPVTGEIVAVYDPARKKWTRNRVLNSTNVVEGNIGRDTFQVWSLDEGVPKEAAAKYVKPLPTKYTHSENLHVKQGALRNIISINHFYDPVEGRLCEKVSADWDNS
uniref:Uncharacterized protein n=1 Tax=Anopheles atroparvus TaxID=41427 RepID=A0AAG5DW87_ANOAO